MRDFISKASGDSHDYNKPKLQYSDYYNWEEHKQDDTKYEQKDVRPRDYLMSKSNDTEEEKYI